MRVLVTGGAGFIGSHVVDALRRMGHEPRIFDLAHSRYHRPNEVEMVLGDLCDAETLRTAIRGSDVVLHLAAVSDVNLVVEDPARAELVNARGTHALLEAARLEDVERVIYASTVWVYGGATGAGPLDEEVTLALPQHFYTATKLAGEMYCRTYGNLFGVGHTILRFGIPYGPRAREATVVAAFVARARAGKQITINGDGRQSRQFVYVEDLAAGIVAALSPLATGRIYNLVGAESVTVREIADTVRELLADVPIVHVQGRLADLDSAEISAERAAHELGWRPTTPFVEGVRRYVEWLAPRNGMSRSMTASITNGRAAAVVRQEPSEL